jgi:lysine decarboxylase
MVRVAAEPLPSRRLVPVEPGLDQRRAPVVEALTRYQAAGTVSFSTPGHKGGGGAEAALRNLLGADLFAADVWLNSGDHARALAEAEALAADAWGADRSLFLTNGSTGGNQALLPAALRPGDEVVVARDAHRSLLTGLVMSGARPVWVTPRLHPELHVGLGIAAEDVAAALDAHPAARLVALVSPTYWGIATDLGAVAEVAHGRGVPLYVDEAWGPHLPFHPDLPPAAMAAGADAAVTSAHKLLGSLGQGALLNLRGTRLDAERVATTVRMTQTTSPSLPILASLDASRRQMALNGRALMARTIELAATARRRLAAIPRLAVHDAARLGVAPHRFDPTRLVIDVGGLGLTGFAAERHLRERFGIAPEMSDLVGVVCLITIGDTPASVDRLVQAFAFLARERGLAAPADPTWPRSSGVAVAPGPQALTPREAFFAPTRRVPLRAAAGEIAAEAIVPYPPGIPALVPGETVSVDKIAYLQAAVARGLHVCGASDPTLATIAVVDV